MKRVTRPVDVVRHVEPPFTGVDWSTSTQRPGCQDFLKCPSRRGDGLHEYRKPLLNASSIKQPMKDAK
jgi:hypothetical protein